MLNSGIRRGLTAAGLVLFLATGCRVDTQERETPAQLVSVSVQPDVPSLAPGTSLQLDVIGMYDNGATRSVTASATWQSSDPSIASVDESGFVTAGNPGSAILTATVGSVSASTTVTSSPVVSIALSPGDPTIASGTAVEFTATGSLLNGAAQNLTAFVAWESSNTAVATVTGSGQANALPSITGSTVITASFGTITGSTTLTSAAVTSIAVTPLTAGIALGTSQQFTATAGLAGGFTQDLTASVLWNSSIPTVAVIGSTTASPGLAVSVSPGTTAISASFSGVTSNDAALTVQPAVLVSLSVTPASSSLAVGTVQQFTATGAFSDGTTQDVTESATWTTSASQVVSVSSAAGTKGLVTALAPGTAAVSASFSGVTSNAAAITVTAAALVSISVTPSNPTVVVGFGVQFFATGAFSDNTTQDLTNAVTWSSSSGIALISDATGSKGQAATSGTGTVTITASFGGVSGSTTLTIAPF